VKKDTILQYNCFLSSYISVLLERKWWFASLHVLNAMSFFTCVYARTHTNIHVYSCSLF
jgi:hypothetical protein